MKYSPPALVAMTLAAATLALPALAPAQDQDQGQGQNQGSSSKQADDSVFLFPYFQSNGETGVFLAWSEDGRHFKSLNDGKPVFTPPQWPDQNLTRDPSIVYHDGSFEMVWTSNWVGRFFGHASSKDLMHWTGLQEIQPFSPDLPDADQPRNVWAPELHHNPANHNFFIVFSSTTDREFDDGDGSEDLHGSDHRLFMVTTKHFEKYAKPELVNDPGYSIIDGQAEYDDRDTQAPGDDRWVMAVKREQGVKRGGKNIRLMFNNPGLTKDWSPVSDPVVGPGTDIQPSELAEGPTILKDGDQWLLYWDSYKDNHYSLATSPDLEHWTDETDQLSFPVTHPRHGTIFKAPRSALTAFPEIAKP